jgi:tetratricopeptide (TPR) repeat protein
MHLGGALEAEGEIAASLDSYRRAAMLAPHLAETHYNVGNALRLLGRPAPAREAWERSLQQNPDFLDALLNLAAHYQDAGDWEQTWLLLDRAEAVQPRSAEVWRRKGLARKLNGDMAGAERDYRRALKLDQTMAEAHYNLANLSYEAGRIDSAGRHYTRALRHNAAHHGAATNLALMLINAGDAAAAVRICRDALRHTPDQSKLFYLLASALDAQGQTSEALVNFRIFLRFRDARGSVLLAVQRRIEQLEAIHK